jgi:hypothetical protein
LKFHFCEEERLQSVYQYNGMFAFGLWDEKASRLWVCRDRLTFRYGLANRVSKFLVFQQFCFTPKFIRRFLSDWGFSGITVLNSPPSEGDPDFSMSKWLNPCSPSVALQALAGGVKLERTSNNISRS